MSCGGSACSSVLTSSSVLENYAPPRHAKARRADGSFIGDWLAFAIGCHARQRQRKALLELDERMLKDIGISREQAIREAKKPFWK